MIVGQLSACMSDPARWWGGVCKLSFWFEMPVGFG